jgi:hypothetical protein
VGGHQTHELAEYYHRPWSSDLWYSQRHCPICSCMCGARTALNDGAVPRPAGRPYAKYPCGCHFETLSSCRSFVTPDSDPGSSQSRASRDWWDRHPACLLRTGKMPIPTAGAHPAGDCFGLTPSQCQFWPFILTISESNGNYSCLLVPRQSLGTSIKQSNDVN